MENQVKDYAERGLRTLGVARAFVTTEEEEESKREFVKKIFYIEFVTIFFSSHFLM